MNVKYIYPVLSLALATSQCFASTIVDVDQEDGIFAGSGWQSSTYVPQTYGRNYEFNRRSGPDPDTGPTLTLRATAAEITATGTYTAYARWTAGQNRCSNARIEVRRDDGSDLLITRTKDMKSDGSQWIPLVGWIFSPPRKFLGGSDGLGE